MNSKKILIPGAMTFAGAACGFVSLVQLIDGRFVAGMLWMFVAVLFDGLDGKVASLLNCKSEIGSILDSHADVVSFALLPGVAIYLLFHRASHGNPWIELAAWSGGIGYTCAAVFREVRFMAFQVKRQRRQGFVGLPIAPPAGLHVAALTLANLIPETLQRPWPLAAIYGLVLWTAYLMTFSKLVYLRWGGGAIVLQALAAAAVGAVARFALGSSAIGLAGFFAAFCAIYVVYPPLHARFRRAPGQTG